MAKCYFPINFTSALYYRLSPVFFLNSYYIFVQEIKVKKTTNIGGKFQTRVPTMTSFSFPFFFQSKIYDP